MKVLRSKVRVRILITVGLVSLLLVGGYFVARRVIGYSFKAVVKVDNRQVTRDDEQVIFFFLRHENGMGARPGKVSAKDPLEGASLTLLKLSDTKHAQEDLTHEVYDLLLAGDHYQETIRGQYEVVSDSFIDTKRFERTTNFADDYDYRFLNYRLHAKISKGSVTLNGKQFPRKHGQLKSYLKQVFAEKGLSYQDVIYEQVDGKFVARFGDETAKYSVSLAEQVTLEAIYPLDEVIATYDLDKLPKNGNKIEKAIRRGLKARQNMQLFANLMR